MASEVRQLGIENLESRLNMSATPAAVASSAVQLMVAALRSRGAGPKLISMYKEEQGAGRGVATSILPKKPTTPVVASSTKSTTVKSPVKPVVSKPVVTKPVVSKPITSVPTVTTPSTTPAKTTPSTTTSTATVTPAAPPPPVTAAVTSTTSSITTTTATTTTPATSNTTVTNTSSQSLTPDPLAPILAKLYGDDVHDDSATMQQLVDAANAQGLTSITLPAGTFLLDRQIDLYGTNLTFSGQGDQTILDVNHFFTGVPGGADGVGIEIAAHLNATPLMIAKPVTGNTIVFTGNVNLQAGQKIFLSDGWGSTALIEAQRHGNDTGAGAFQELGPDEYVQIASVSLDANGNTVATLTQNVIGTGDYGNVAPAGMTSANYLHASTIDRATDHITVQNLAIKLKDMWADISILGMYTDHLTINHVHILNQSTAGGLGGISIVGSTNALLESITSPTSIALNSTRASTVTGCTVGEVTLEESCTDDLITKNTLIGTTTCDFRINDMACERNTFSFNDVHGGVQNTGAIAIAEGVDTTIANNVVHDGAATIWLGLTSGSKVLNNVAMAFGNYNPLYMAIVSGNSW